MPKYKYGDMVTIKNEIGSYMVLGPYLGTPPHQPENGLWIADIASYYMTAFPNSHNRWATWVAEEQLEPIDDE